MPIPAWRAKQSTSTSGTGTLTLNASASGFRSFNAAFGASSIKVLYGISGASYFEIGVGTFSGGSPGTLTRDTVLASSNAGALVSLPAGVSDVFAVFLPNQAETVSFSVTSTVQLADLGCIFHFTGTAAATLNLPAIANVPPNTGIVVRNSAAITTAGVLTIDPNASEQINGATTLLLFPGESVQLYAVGGAWFAAGLPTGLRTIRRQTPSAVAQVDFTLPAGFAEFELTLTRMSPATDGALAWLRTSSDGGSTFASAASDYTQAGVFVGPGPAAAATAAAGNSLLLSAGQDASSILTGRFTFFPGDGSASFTMSGHSSYVDNNGGGTPFWSSGTFGGNRNVTTAQNAIRVMQSTGNIAAGTLTLAGRL